MDKIDFLHGLHDLEKIFRREYDKAEKNALVKDILRGFHPSVEEWNKVIQRLRTAEERYDILPTVPKVVTAMKAVRRDSRDKRSATTSVNCKSCAGLGVLWIVLEHPAAPGTTYRAVVPCGCENTPAWLADEPTVNARIKSGAFDATMFENVNHERLVDTYTFD